MGCAQFRFLSGENPASAPLHADARLGPCPGTRAWRKKACAECTCTHPSRVLPVHPGAVHPQISGSPSLQGSAPGGARGRPGMLPELQVRSLSRPWMQKVLEM